MTTARVRTPVRLAFVAGCAWAAVAAAYVLPGHSVLRRMAQARDELNLTALKAEGQAALRGPAAQAAAQALGVSPPAAEGTLQVDATLWMRPPGRCRLELTAAESDRTVAAVVTPARKRFEGVEVAPLFAALEQVCGLLGARSSGGDEGREAVQRHLSALRVTTSQSALARFGGQVAYVLGAPGDGQAQLWVYKDSFLPARVRYTDAQGAGWDVRLLDYGASVVGESFPRVVEVFRDGSPVLRFTAFKADPRPRMDDRLF